MKKRCYRVLYSGDDTAFAIWAESEEEALEKAMTRNKSELEDETDKMDYLVTEFTPETNGTGMLVFYDAYQVRERKGITYANRKKPKTEVAEKSIEIVAYEKFQIYWMLHHGISIKDVTQVATEWLDAKSEDETFDAYLEENGFFGSTIWPCFHEFLNAEYQDAGLMKSILTEKEYDRYKESRVKTYHKTLLLPADVSKKYQEILQMNGKEIYDKFGLKRDEVLSDTIKFEDGCEMDIKLVICNEEERPYTEAVLFKDGGEVSHTFCNNSYLGEWVLENNGNTYIVFVLEEKVITKDMIRDGLHKGVVQLIMSPNGDGIVCQIGEYWFYFGGLASEQARSVNEYRSWVSEQQITDNIFNILYDFKNDFPDEYNYYLAVLMENEKYMKKGE